MNLVGTWGRISSENDVGQSEPPSDNDMSESAQDIIQNLQTESRNIN